MPNVGQKRRGWTKCCTLQKLQLELLPEDDGGAGDRGGRCCGPFGPPRAAGPGDSELSRCGHPSRRSRRSGADRGSRDAERLRLGFACLGVPARPLQDARQALGCGARSQPTLLGAASVRPGAPSTRMADSDGRRRRPRALSRSGGCQHAARPSRGMEHVPICLRTL